MSTAIRLLFLLLFLSCKTSYVPDTGDDIRIVITLDGPAESVLVKPATLKYNKDFAFSFTLDDGLISDYLVAYPFFYGGEVAGSYKDQWGIDQGGNGLHYPGLYYTDGSGNALSFRAAIAINGRNIEGADTVLHPGFLSWKQVQELYEAGWGVLNHGYTHATGNDVDALDEIKSNNTAVNRHIGLAMKGFVVPGGNKDSASNPLYIQAACNLEMQTVQCENFGNYLIMPDTVSDLSCLRLGRLFMHTAADSVLLLRSGPNLTIKGTQAGLFRTIHKHLEQGRPFWINAFTHGVGNQNVWGISVILPEFIHFFNRLAAQYGGNGMDNMWMAPTQEVYDYLRNKRAAKYTVRKNANTIQILMKKNNLPKELRYHELTFILTAGRRIQLVKCSGCSIESYSNGIRNNLINCKWE